MDLLGHFLLILRALTRTRIVYEFRLIRHTMRPSCAALIIVFAAETTALTGDGAALQRLQLLRLVPLLHLRGRLGYRVVRVRFLAAVDLGGGHLRWPFLIEIGALLKLPVQRLIVSRLLPRAETIRLSLA